MNRLYFKDQKIALFHAERGYCRQQTFLYIRIYCIGNKCCKKTFDVLKYLSNAIMN